MNKLQWQCGYLKDYNALQTYAFLRLRQDVFIIEQQCIYPDIDDIDHNSQHLTAWDKYNKLAAVARIIAPTNSHHYCAIGRVAVDRQYRGLRLGYDLMQKAIDICQKQFPNIAIEISAQQRLEGFYNSLGFKAISDMYLEDDIPHIRMRHG